MFYFTPNVVVKTKGRYDEDVNRFVTRKSVTNGRWRSLNKHLGEERLPSDFDNIIQVP